VTYLVDANMLVYATDANSRHNESARTWLDDQLAGHPQTVALPWPTLLSYLRVITSHRVFPNALRAEQAWSQIDDWLDRRAAWVPVPGPRHALLLRELVTTATATGNLVAVAHLAALAQENGLSVVSADTDFAKFPGIKWINPLGESKPR
jgi:toxin-antitoxin system PIN domain toxin